MMNKKDMEPIVKTYYDALEEGRILGRKCKKCGHIEFPPYLCCNECGCLDTEWIEMNDVQGTVKQVLPTIGAFGDPEFRQKHGDYWAVEVDIPGCDPLATSLIHVDYDKLNEFSEVVRTEEHRVKPIIIQDEEIKVVLWELEENSPFRKVSKVETVEEEKAEEEPEASSEDLENDEIAKKVIASAAEAYEVDEDKITLSTNIREDLSNESMKMIVMISQIEDELDVTIEIQEANYLTTIRDFVNKVKEKM